MIFGTLLLLVCVLRLIQMQLLPDSSLQDAIEELKQGKPRQLKTVRGQILDRKGRILATDELRFQLSIEYKLCCFLDERLARARLLRAASLDNADAVLPKVQDELQTGLKNLQDVIEKCTHFGKTRPQIEDRIRQINDKIWNLRQYNAWKRSYPDTDFNKAVPDPNSRLLMTAKEDISEMHKNWPLFELKTDDEVLAAQLEFINNDGVHIQPGTSRIYPYKSVASQTIGWVGLATQEKDKKLFADDRLASYLDDEVCGREDGVEYACEAVLRGRRGELVFDIDRQLVNRTETQPGEDVTLTIDIELQQRIENYLANYHYEPNCGPGTAAVVIDVATGDILSLVSMPVFDLNRVRNDYGILSRDPNKPLANRAINQQYPPGSVVKPLILIAGLESAKITPDEIISCPAQAAPTGWPNCWIYNQYKTGHDNSWPNNARNAIKGSCNIYFSRLADRLEPAFLQQWLFKFGYGQCTRLASSVERDAYIEKVKTTDAIHNTQDATRELRQLPGQISTNPPSAKNPTFEQIPALNGSEKKLFGMGQGNLRATPLQVANAMAAIARGGLYKPPQLFLVHHPSSIVHHLSSDETRGTRDERRDLGISPHTLEIIRDGMWAVVNEPGGTAYNEFAYSGLGQQNVTVYGKTGSTEGTEVAWFGGFAEDGKGAKLAIAVVVEGGQHGSRDAAPLARDIIQFCIEAGFLGKAVNSLN